MFSVLDAAKGFWQSRLDKESSKLLTFNTCFGRYRYLRLPFGVSPAPEIYQRKMHEMFDDIEGVEIVMDDILVHGRTIPGKFLEINCSKANCSKSVARIIISRTIN